MDHVSDTNLYATLDEVERHDDGVRQPTAQDASETTQGVVFIRAVLTAHVSLLGNKTQSNKRIRYDDTQEQESTHSIETISLTLTVVTVIVNVSFTFTTV